MTWQRTDNTLPVSGEIVKTISPGGYETELLYSDGLWFFTDKSMYVYYTPEFWKRMGS